MHFLYIYISTQSVMYSHKEEKTGEIKQQYQLTRARWPLLPQLPLYAQVQKETPSVA